MTTQEYNMIIESKKTDIIWVMDKNVKKTLNTYEKRKKKMNNWFHKRIVNPYRSFRRGIINIFSWFPIIWEDRQFDQSYLYIVLRHKLKLMEDFYFSDLPCAMYAEKRGKEIRIARILCDRIIKSEYTSNAMDYFKVPRDTYKDIYGHSDYMEKQDKDYLFDLMRKKIDRWWD
jgi:hypothetical protein